MEIINATALISINETLFAQLISFLIFLFILNRVMIQPLLQTMEQRKDHFAIVKEDIEKAHTDLDSITKDLDEQRKSVLKEADSVVKTLEAEADKSASEVMDAARSQITALRQETEQKVEAQIKAAREQLTGEVDAITTIIMEKVLHRSLQS
ncbi:AtpG3: predicted ATP synthase, subunit gamma (ATP synthase F1 sector subunit gamma) [Desulfosarcina variabilis str. Montpellier]|uniref:F0F1 ATP synthase subunit B family protein n=1 Tax=Desulfosarcina variabilis TaxID=2300 RepID=UPI003AFB13B3